MFTYISHTYTHSFLVVGGISISRNDLLDPVWHGLHQFLQVLRIQRTHSFLISTFNSSRLVGCVSFSFIFIPGIFNGVQVRAVACQRLTGISAIETHPFKCPPNKKFLSQDSATSPTASRNTPLSNPTGLRGIACTKLKICTTIHRHRFVTPTVFGDGSIDVRVDRSTKLFQLSHSFH